MAALMSMRVGEKSGRSAGSIVDVQSGSFVPLTIETLQRDFGGARRALRRDRALRAAAACVCDWTTSMGASVPISTFDWLFLTSSSARLSDCCATSTDCTANT